MTVDYPRYYPHLRDSHRLARPSVIFPLSGTLVLWKNLILCYPNGLKHELILSFL